MAIREDLIKYVPADYDVNKIGFILLGDDSSSDSMEIDNELTPAASKPSTENPNKCHICHRVYMNRSNLKRHLNSVHTLKIFSCVVCNQTFETLRQLTYHKKTHQKLVCDFCGREEKSKKDMINHFEIHTGFVIDIDDIFHDM